MDFTNKVLCSFQCTGKFYSASAIRNLLAKNQEMGWMSETYLTLGDLKISEELYEIGLKEHESDESESEDEDFEDDPRPVSIHTYFIYSQKPKPCES